VRVAYADPPYIGQAKKHYNSTEVDHLDLLRELSEYDGWALSCSSTTLKEILSLPTCPNNVRIGAWIKPFCSFKPNVNPAYAWEPVLFIPARNGTRDEDTKRDWVSSVITLKKGLVGVKPEIFCMWLFDLLGLEVEDEFYDLFPGTNAVTDAYKKWVNRFI